MDKLFKPTRKVKLNNAGLGKLEKLRRNVLPLKFSEKGWQFCPIQRLGLLLLGLSPVEACGTRSPLI